MSGTIIVSGASEWMTPYHDRMPVLLARVTASIKTVIGPITEPKQSLTASVLAQSVDCPQHINKNNDFDQFLP